MLLTPGGRRLAGQRASKSTSHKGLKYTDSPVPLSFAYAKETRATRKKLGSSSQDCCCGETTHRREPTRQK